MHHQLGHAEREGDRAWRAVGRARRARPGARCRESAVRGRAARGAAGRRRAARNARRRGASASSRPPPDRAGRANRADAAPRAPSRRTPPRRRREGSPATHAHAGGCRCASAGSPHRSAPASCASHSRRTSVDVHLPRQRATRQRLERVKASRRRIGERRHRRERLARHEIEVQSDAELRRFTVHPLGPPHRMPALRPSSTPTTPSPRRGPPGSHDSRPARIRDRPH